MQSTCRKKGSTLKEDHEVAFVETSSTFDLMHFIPYMSSSLKNKCHQRRIIFDSLYPEQSVPTHSSLLVLPGDGMFQAQRVVSDSGSTWQW